MARSGTNPQKWIKTIKKPRNVSLVTAVHIPEQEGYWSEALEVFELCAKSARINTKIEFDFVVLDNGSCAEVGNRLLEMSLRGDIDYLVRASENTGKVGAWNILFTMDLGEYVSYTDCDVLFFPSWLEKSLEIINAFDKAGIVTAQPIAGGDLSDQWTVRDAEKHEDIEIRTGILIPDEYTRAVIMGLGRGEDEFQRRNVNRKDAMLVRNGVKAYACASHFQFTSRRAVLRSLFPAETSIPLGDDLQFDVEMEKSGYWRLATNEFLSYHMGNKLPRGGAEKGTIELLYPGYDDLLNSEQIARNDGSRMSRLRKLAKAINKLTYRYIYE